MPDMGALFSSRQNQPRLLGEPGSTIDDKRMSAKFGFSATPLSCLSFDWLECTVFANVEARAVAFNVFLDGRPGRR